MVALSNTGGYGAARVEDSIDVSVKVAGKDLDGSELSRISEIKIHQTLGKVASLELKVAAWDPDTDDLNWVDDDRFTPGNDIEVTLGYSGATQVMFSGNFSSLSLEASTTMRAQLTLGASDVLNRLARGETPKKYLKTTYAKIVRDIAAKANLSVDAPDDNDLDPENEKVEEAPMSDLTFMFKLASRIGYDLYADGAKVVFHKSHLGDKATLQLTAQDHLLHYHAELSATVQLGGVDVFALDTMNKKFLSASHDNPDSADRAFKTSNTRAVTIDGALVKQEQLDARAKLELTNMRSEFISVSGECFGRIDLRPGIVVSFANLGKRFGGDAYLSDVTHLVTPGGGYRTSFTAKGQPQ